MTGTPMRTAGRPARAGAALVIAMLILAALLLLGLPFMFSQLSGVAGSRSFQAAAQARIYANSAVNLGTALAVYANTSGWSPTTEPGPGITPDPALRAQLHSAIGLYLAGFPQAGVVAAKSTINETLVDPAPLGWNGGTAVKVGLSIADEAGKLDANTLNDEGWSQLLKAVGIPDWDDEEVQITWPINQGPDGDKIGQLANSLVARRMDGRYTRLEELLEASPQTFQWGTRYTELRKPLARGELELLRPYLTFHNPSPGRSGLLDLGSIIYSDEEMKASGPLSTNANFKTYYKDTRYVDDLPASQVNDGTWLLVEKSPGAAPRIEAITQVRRYAQVIGGISTYTTETKLFHRGTTVNPTRDSGMFIQAPPPLNLHQMPELLRNLDAYKHAYDPTSEAFPVIPPSTMVTWYGQQVPDPGDPSKTINALPTRYLAPAWTPAAPAAPNLPVPHERQALDLRSGGTVRIDAAATIHDRADALAAQESRTVLMQAVAQEGPVERRWMTQGMFEPLVAQRMTSQMATWPMATNRVTDLAPDDVDPATGQDPSTGLYAPRAETGLTSAIQRTIAVSGTMPHLQVSWRALPGPATALTQATVLDDSQAGTASGLVKGADADARGIAEPPISQGTAGGLYPDGVRLGPGSTLAYRFSSPNAPLVAPATTPTANPVGPLTWTSANDGSMSAHHISFWFKPETNWSILPEPLTLVEARGLKDYTDNIQIAGLTPAALAIGTDFQNYFGVFYDPTENMLVLAYGPPGVPSIAAPSPWTALIDDPDTAQVDERCLDDSLQSLVAGSQVGGLLSPPRMNKAQCEKWSKSYRPNRIMTLWKLGKRIDSTGAVVRNFPEQGRWYHLQVSLGNGRPGGLGLALDGITGTDVGYMTPQDRPGIPGYWSTRFNSDLKGPWPGDHLTVPGLLLLDDLDDLPDVKKANPTAADIKKLYPDKIGVAMPGFSAFLNTHDAYVGATPPVNKGVNALSPADTLPSRGTVLIGDEYIRYESMDYDSVKNRWNLLTCARGARQDTWSDHVSANSPNDHYPTTEKHIAGSRVLADGARLTGLSGALYIGGTTLKQPVFSAGIATEDFRITAKLQADPVNADGTTQWSVTDTSNWADAPDHGVVQISDSYYAYQKPAGDPMKVILAPPDAGKLKTLLHAPATDLVSTAGPITNKPTMILVSMEVGDDSIFTPGHFEVPSGNGGSGSALALQDANGRLEWLRYTHMVKIDTWGANFPTSSFFINSNGWRYDATQGRDRGRWRTPFLSATPFAAGSQVLPVQHGPTNFKLKVLAAGDVVSLVPTSYAARPTVVAMVRYCANDGYDQTANALNDTVNGYLSFSAPLRSAAGISTSLADYEIVMGTGYNSRHDLTPLSNAFKTVVEGGDMPLAAMPRLDAHKNATESGRLVFGDQDRGRLSTFWSPPDVPAATHSGPVVSIDAPCAGPLPIGAARVVRVYRGNQVAADIQATMDLPLVVELDANAFPGNTEPLRLIEIGGETFACERLLAKDRGPVEAALTALATDFPDLLPAGTAADPTPAGAYITAHANRFARLVGRALLGSTSLAHPLASSPTQDLLTTDQKNRFRNLDHGSEALLWPIGPVRYVLPNSATGTAIDLDKWFVLSDGKWASPSTYQPSISFAAPVALIADAVRADPEPWMAKHEALLLATCDLQSQLSAPKPTTGNFTWPNPNYQRWVTAPWLRGLYNTPNNTAWKVQAGGNGDLYPLAIGWWTRYPSALPSLLTAGVPAPLTAQHLRSRRFPWFGFCLRLHNIRFHDTAPFTIAFDRDLAVNQVLTEPDPNLAMEIRAMAGTIAGDQTAAGALGGNPLSFGDWASVPFQAFLVPTTSGVTWTDILNLYAWNGGAVLKNAKETDGVEVRVSFRYTGETTGDLSALARAANRAPLISGAKLRGYAPVSTLSVESAR